MGLWFNWFAGKLGEDAKLWWIVWSHYLKYHWFKYSNFYKFFSENSDWFCFPTPMSPLSSGAPWGSGLTCTNNWCIRGLKVDKKLYRMIQLFKKKKAKTTSTYQHIASACRSPTAFIFRILHACFNCEFLWCLRAATKLYCHSIGIRTVLKEGLDLKLVGKLGTVPPFK